MENETTAKPRGIRLSDEVHRALMKHSVDTGESVGRIIERLARADEQISRYLDGGKAVRDS